ncbi:hypothetical protein Droror1_Dr00003178 [Drosera rotundifolia]
MCERVIPRSSGSSSSAEEGSLSWDSSSSWGSYVTQPEMPVFNPGFQSDSEEENVVEERQAHGYPTESTEQSGRSDGRSVESGDLPPRGIGLSCEDGASISSGHCGSKEKDVSDEAQEQGVTIESAECSRRADKRPMEMGGPSHEVSVSEVAHVKRGFRPLTIGARSGFSSLGRRNNDEDQVEAVIRAQKQEENQQIDNALLEEGKLRSDMELTQREIEQQVMEASLAEHLALNKVHSLLIPGVTATSGAEHGQCLGSSFDNPVNVTVAQLEAVIKALEDKPDNALLAEEKLNLDVDLTEKEIERQMMGASLAEYSGHEDSTMSGAGPSSTGAGLSEIDRPEDLDVLQAIENENVNVTEAQHEAVIKTLEDKPDNVLQVQEKLNSDVELTEKEIERQVMEASLAEYREQPVHGDSTTSGAGPSSSGVGSSQIDGPEDLDVSQAIESESLRTVLSMGFDYTLTIEAYTICGEDVNSMINYIIWNGRSSN